LIAKIHVNRALSKLTEEDKENILNVLKKWWQVLEDFNGTNNWCD
jgi:hypothetical protein